MRRLGIGLAAMLLLAAHGASARRIFVTVAGNDANDGLSWATAKASLAAALDVARSTPEADTVRVAEGVYDAVSFLGVPAHVALLGGYPPGGGTQRDPRAHPTTLDKGGAPRQVVFFDRDADETMIDGFILRRGGAAISVRGAGPLIRDCIMEQNDGGIDRGVYGPGVMAYYTTPSVPLRVEDCVIRDNIGGLQFGAPMPSAVYINAYDDALEMDLEHVMSRTLIEGNVPAVGTGVATAVTIWGQHGRLRDVALRNNVDGRLRIGNADMTNVLAPDGVLQSPAYWPCTPSIWRNVTTSSIEFDDCDGLYSVRREVVDSIVWGTDPALTGGRRGVVVITNSIVQGGWPGGTNIIDADPQFVAGPEGDFYLGDVAAGQPTTSPAVDAGSVTAVEAGMDARTTRTDSGADAGMVDLGYHPEPVLPFGLGLRRGPVADGLSPYRTIADLPFTDSERTLTGPWFRLLYYDIPNSPRDIVVLADRPNDAVRVAWR